MARDVAGLGDREGAREQQPAAIAVVADALRDAGEPRHQRGVESVLQQDGGVEGVGAQAAGEPDAGAPAALGGARDHGVDGRFAGEEIGHPGPRDERDVGVRIHAADGAQGGQRHDGVADPVGGADEDF